MHVAVETALEVPPEPLEAVLNEVDLVLADLKASHSDDHQAWTGRGNERILANFRLLTQFSADRGHPSVIARTPLVPGHTATLENLQGIRTFLRSLPASLPWELLDFNPLARSKYTSLGRTAYPFAHLSHGLPTELLERLRQEFQP